MGDRVLRATGALAASTGGEIAQPAQPAVGRHLSACARVHPLEGDYAKQPLKQWHHRGLLVIRKPTEDTVQHGCPRPSHIGGHGPPLGREMQRHGPSVGAGTTLDVTVVLQPVHEPDRTRGRNPTTSPS